MLMQIDESISTDVMDMCSGNSPPSSCRTSAWWRCPVGAKLLTAPLRSG